MQPTRRNTRNTRRGNAGSHVVGQFLRTITAIVSGGNQFRLFPSSVGNGGFGTRTAELCGLYERFRFRSVTVDFLSNVGGGPVLIGFVRSGLGSTTLPQLTTAADVSECTKVYYSHSEQTVPCHARFDSQDLNPSSGWYDADGDSVDWAMYFTAVSASTGLAVAADMIVVIRYDIEFDGAVPPAAFRERMARLAAAPADDVSEGYIQVGESAVVPVSAPKPQPVSTPLTRPGSLARR
jgi:hypothetical protein